MEYVIFAIDNNSDLHTTAKFMRMVDEKRAMGYLGGDLVQCIGFWEGVLEPSYMINKEDFDKFILNSGYVNRQECFLLVPSDVKQPCVLTFSDGSAEPTAPMRQVNKDKLGTIKGWTYVIKSGKYFTTDKE